MEYTIFETGKGLLWGAAKSALLRRLLSDGCEYQDAAGLLTCLRHVERYDTWEIRKYPSGNFKLSVK